MHVWVCGQSCGISSVHVDLAVESIAFAAVVEALRHFFGRLEQMPATYFSRFMATLMATYFSRFMATLMATCFSRLMATLMATYFSRLIATLMVTYFSRSTATLMATCFSRLMAKVVHLTFVYFTHSRARVHTHEMQQHTE